MLTAFLCYLFLKGQNIYNSFYSNDFSKENNTKQNASKETGQNGFRVYRDILVNFAATLHAKVSMNAFNPLEINSCKRELHFFKSTCECV